MPYLEDTPKNILVSEDETNVSVSYSFFSFYPYHLIAREGIPNDNDFNFSCNVNILSQHASYRGKHIWRWDAKCRYEKSFFRENIYNDNNGEKKDKTIREKTKKDKTDNGNKTTKTATLSLFNKKQKKHSPFPNFIHSLFSPPYIFPNNKKPITLSLFPPFSQYTQTYIFSPNTCYSLFPRCESTGVYTQQKNDKTFFQTTLQGGIIKKMYIKWVDKKGKTQGTMSFPRGIRWQIFLNFFIFPVFATVSAFISYNKFHSNEIIDGVLAVIVCIAIIIFWYACIEIILFQPIQRIDEELKKHGINDTLTIHEGKDWGKIQ